MDLLDTLEQRGLVANYDVSRTMRYFLSSATGIARRITAVVVFSILIPPSASYAAEAGARERTFLRALERFESAKSHEEYEEVAGLLESLLIDGFRNGAVYYNLGNAYFRAGEYGKAILAYRKARAYRPRDPYLEANLRHALSVAPGRLPEPPPPWWTHILFWIGWMSLPEKIYAAWAGYMLAAAMASAALLLRRPRAYWAGAACAMVALILSIDAGLASADVFWSRRAVVTAETVALKGIGKDYEPAFDQPLKDGAEFTVLAESGDWVFGHFEGVGDGWLRNDCVAR
jgi:tetratricopeptide (TPR) repeat protein